MENDFIIHNLGCMAAAVTEIENFNNELKNSICILLGYLKADSDNKFTDSGGAYSSLSYVDSDTKLLDFDSKEISKMPKQFRKDFRTNGLRAHVRKRTRGNSTSFEIRCRRNGYNISATGHTLEEAKTKFIKKLSDIQDGTSSAALDVPKQFDKFALYYFDKFRKRKVTPETYYKDMLRLNKHIIPYFGNILLKNITPQSCQELIDSIVTSGKSKTAEEVFSLLNCTFKTAIKHGIILHNPLDIVVHDKHERKHGKALTIEEEERLLQSTEYPFKLVFAIALYTGIRPNEYPTVHIEQNMIYARNSKRHNGKEEIKRIPITPMLIPFITAETTMPIITINKIRAEFNAIFGSAHKLYDLRTTFYTRCQMCGVTPAARDEFMGHTSGVLVDTYTDLPDDYLIAEGKKLVY